MYTPVFAKEPRDLVEAKGVIFGDKNAVGYAGLLFAIYADIFGWDDAKTVWGYTGQADAQLAMLAGELNMHQGSVIGYHVAFKPYEEKGEGAALSQGGLLDDKGNIVRDPGLPNVPTVPEIYEEYYGKPLPEMQMAVYKGIVVAPRVFGKSYHLPPGTPDHILTIWDKAVKEMTKDPEFLEAFDKVAPGRAPFLFYKDDPEVWKAVCRVSPEVLEYTKKLAEKYGAVFD